MHRLLSVVFCLFVSIAAIAADGRYNVIVLGDMHFDRMEYHDPDYPKKNTREIARYVKVTEQNTPQLLDAAAKQIGADTPFVIQLGDLTQGDCGSRELQEAMFDGAFKLIKTHLPVPFLAVKGNHDVRGPGAKAAWKNRVPPFVGSELQRPIDSGNYTVKHGPDAYIFFDCMEPDMEFLKQTLNENRNARYRFMLTHFPVQPVAGGSSSVLFGRDDAKRLELFRLLLDHEVILFCGHLHRMSFAQYEVDGKSLALVMVNSLADEAKFRNEMTLETCAPLLALEGVELDAKTQELRNRLKAECDRGLKQFFVCQGAGFVKLDVGPDRVTVEYYSGTGEKPVKTQTVR